MYPAAVTWKANSGESEDNPGSNGSMPGVLDELFKSRIMFDNIRSLKRDLNRMGMLYYSCKAECKDMQYYTTFCIDCIDERHDQTISNFHWHVTGRWHILPSNPGPNKNSVSYYQWQSYRNPGSTPTWRSLMTCLDKNCDFFFKFIRSEVCLDKIKI